MDIIEPLMAGVGALALIYPEYAGILSVIGTIAIGTWFGNKLADLDKND